MLTISVIGLGSRGTEYMRFVKTIYFSTAKVNAICDLSEVKLAEIGGKYRIGEDMRFTRTEDFFNRGVLSDGVMICTQDKSHYEITKQAILTGYKNILLEKPVSDSIAECEELKKLSEDNGVNLIVCHVLRYSNYYKKIKNIIDSGEIGELVAINHTENVGYFHFAHSFVRGNWKRADTSTPSLMAKCCHDVDLISWFAGAECSEVSSYGSLKYFNEEHAPQGATQFCLGGCKAKKTCPYDCEYVYLTSPPHKSTFVKYMRRTMTGQPHTSDKQMREFLKTSSYGKCVYLNDNNVNDFQVVNMKFENGVSAVHTLNAFSRKCMRQSHIIGTKGELICTDKKLKLCVFGKSPKNIIAGNPFIPGHGEGDMRTVASFIALLEGKDIIEDITNIAVTVKSHRIVMAAEKSRFNGGIAVRP